MIDIDVIIPTKTDGKDTLTMTKRTMISMQEAEKNYKFHFHLIESGFNCYAQYKYLIDSYFVIRGEDFNYNKSINKGLEAVQYDWVVISNNDVGYEKNWLSEIMAIHTKRPDIESFSPKDPMLYMKYFDWHFVESKDDYFESYKVSEAIMGWSLVIKKNSLDKILPFDEQFDMYYQDNDYGEMLKTNAIKHALVRNSIACHLGTLNIGEERLNQKKEEKLSEGYLKFAKKWGIWE
jgi:hypothetical protein